MFRVFKKINDKKKRYKDIDPDEIFLDSENLPNFDIYQFEGIIERPISKKSVFTILFLFLSVLLLFTYKVFDLQINQGSIFRDKSENNRFDYKIIFADRGIIFDRNEKYLAWNEIDDSGSREYSNRVYATSSGLSNILGYVKYPSKDNNGFYYQTEYEPKSGLEKKYNSILSGKNGFKLNEIDALGNASSQSVIERGFLGQNIYTTIDLDIQKKLFNSMIEFSGRAGYRGGAGAIMDVHTGDIVAMASFPEYDSSVLTEGKDKEKINEYFSNTNNPFLNRFVSGIYTPGSIVKPFIALGVLSEGVISPNKHIFSSGELEVPNPYNPDKPTIFRDWKAHGYVDLKRAIAVSSNVYFFQVGGGFGDQKGLGILNIEKYLRLFGFGSKTGLEIDGEKNGVIPNPEWKKNIFNEDWRLGDTYNTAIGQYGLQVTPIQTLRAVSAIANNGYLITPKLLLNQPVLNSKIEGISDQNFKIVRDGMRMTVTEGTAQSLNFDFVNISAKTGTAELGVKKNLVNSWVIGFFPSEKPKYAFTLVMEKGVANNQVGATLVMREVFEWMNLNKKEYFKVD